MYGNGLFTPEEAQEFIEKHKYAIVAFARHDKVTMNNYLSTTDKLFRYVIENNNENYKYACEKFYTKNFEPPKDVFVEPTDPAFSSDSKEWMPDMGIMFYRDGKCLAHMEDCDMEKFGELFHKLPTIEEEPKQPKNAETQTQPQYANDACCVIL
ncbi:hypothetical protein LPJ78_002042 [Coemansia sp. RSA 989]|nr:hypothetical protein LPJ68_003032 [Coemansia sp. RSA 1086]KAJ1751510.1 hypothetical protein LPJ79_001988 [Coemansia sp. RSA 1821]KAJ1866219.1 hypothetical protein LPJ78_002042 [Coemansia sp. RSA 989]KAJ1873448.1 hypothetical protein LPJ55_002303 [Coemansia sp. RSA 990]KAJ2633297.1 hypothetical protein H4R22_000581 [Coemansia sp. RSA 1290]KAJ2647950.1 hypothetical protein IWW40_004273 [Coemansia sp. RSA 1250]KAJ2670038.1 hypothetical protein IWW42_004238 [Coemansia sp. RSA 1085]